MAEEGMDALKVYWDHFFKAETGTYEKSTWLDLFLAEFIIRVNEGANPKELIKFCPISGVVTLVGCELLCGIHRVTSSINTHCAAPPPGAGAACSGSIAEGEAGDRADESGEYERNSQRAPASSLDVSCTVLENHNEFSERTNMDILLLPKDADAKSEEAKAQPTSLFTRANAQSSEEILRKYILGGVAWRCLVLLKALGVEGLSCCRQLSSVLIWLFGELRGAGAPPPLPPLPPHPRLPPHATHAPRTPIHHLFSHKIWSKQKPTGTHAAKVNIATSIDKGSATGRLKHSAQAKFVSTDKAKKKSSKHSEQSSDSADSNDDLEALNRSLTIKVCTPNDDFEYFNSPLRSSNEYPNESLYSDPYYTPRKAKPKADDYTSDKHREIINSEITTFEFTLIITDLLQELCKTESSLSGAEGLLISVQCINFSLRNLCSLQFSSVPVQSSQNNKEVSRIKLALTELLIVSLDKVLIHSDLCAKLINNGILPMMLRLLEDVISKCCKNSAKDIEKNSSEHLLKFVFGIAYSITAFFHCLLMQCRSVDKLREFTDQFRLYGECLKGGLLKECIELMIRIPVTDEDEAVTLIKKLIESIGKLVSAMKRVRSEVIHCAACPRSRHKVCRQRVMAGMHHHHDILGEAGSGLPMSSTCCVSVLYGTLTSLLTDDEVTSQMVLRNKILRVMLNCGVCCCFSPGFLMESIVRLMMTHNSVAALCLQVLEHTVYGDLGASILIPKVTDQLPCSTCQPCDDKRDTGKKYCLHSVSPAERKNVWSFLIHYNSLLQLDNHNNVLHATVSHLLRVTPKCRMEMKYELLFSVIYPTFIVAKHRYIIRLEESAYFLTVSCLNIFASLLNTISFAEQFIQKGGLSYVLELVSLPEFSIQCCSILEIAIIVEIFKLIKENSEMNYYREMSTLSSVQMLAKSLSDMSEKCYEIYRLKLPVDKFKELCDISKEREMLSVNQKERRHSTPKSINTDCGVSAAESAEENIDVLNNIWTFWKTCAGLCLYSPMFREYVVTESVFLDSYSLLKVLLYYLCNCECAANEMRVLIKIMEALLTVQFAVADVTSGRSKEASCAIVRGALATPAPLLEGGGGAGGGGGLRAVCEALIRVATAEPSRHHAMPRITHAKMPPLVCTAGGSSAGSSSEGSDVSAGSEGSEGSAGAAPGEIAHPDDGYEADVEIGKFDIPASYKLRKISATVTSTAPSEVPAAAGAGEGGAAHPELCVIVVDILTQLIQKVLAAQSGGEATAGLQRVGAQLARACSARAAAAPAQPLLPRLLARAHARLLAATHPHLEDLQRSVLELIHALASQSITASELAAYLKLFTSEKPPLTPLLNSLQQLLAAAAPNTPDCILTFPIDIDNKDGLQSLSEDMSPLGVAGPAPDRRAAALRDSHLKAGVESPWAAGALSCGVQGAGWAPWLAGFALVLWLQRAPLRPHARPPRDDMTDIHDESSDAESSKRRSPPRARAAPLHVLSVGHDSLMFELWFDVVAGTFIFRLSRPESNCNRIVSEARTTSSVAPRHWSCVALNVAERMHKRHIHIQVTLFINGCECEILSLPVQGILVRKVTPTNVLVGHATRGGGGGGGGGAYHLSSVQLYRAPALSTATALHLAAHGPDHSCRVHCESPNYSLILTPNVLDSNIDWDQVYEISSTTLRELHDNLLLTFSANAPHIINLYHQTVALPTVFGGRVASTAGLMAAAGVAGAVGAAAGGAAAGASIPETLFPAWGGAPLPSRHRGIAPAIYMLGGPDILLYLFARVVELEGTAAEQAAALGLVLRAARVDGRLHAALHAGATLDMLLTVLAAPKCRLDHRLLEVILNEAFSSPVLALSGDSILVLGRSDAVLLEPELLVLLMKAWRQLDTEQELRWEVEGAGSARVRECGSTWALALRAVRVPLRARHPRRAFNHYQMSRLALLHHLLLACKERFLNSERGPLDESTCGSLVALVRGLLGSPPLLHHLAMLADFLLLMHQASDTFVTHSRANFYFLLTSETQEMSEFSGTLKRKASKRARKLNPPDAPNVSSASTDDINDNSLKLKDMAQTQLENDKIDSSVESTKQLKGIINMQIREGRKQNMSSTSDNSDTTAEHGAEGGEGERGADEQELTEYIVVDAEDVNHTTVEMYTGGIYHQRRVRAGAAPGWAAYEGLLLLLRDAVGVLPDHELAQALCGAIQPESLVVLGNHRSARVRAALVRALAALQRRAPADLARRLHQHHYYVHLANQISLYEGSWELASACAALLTKCDVPLEDQLDDDIWVDVSEESIHRSPPLLALLPCCLHDVPLAHNITLIIRKIIDKASLKLIVEVSVAEVVVRCVRAAGLLPAGLEGRALLLQDLQELLNRIAIKALAANHTMQIISELHHMLTYIEISAASGEGEERGAAVVRAARDAQLSLYNAQLDYLEERLHSSYTAQTKHASYFSSVLSSAVSLGAERSELAARLLAAVTRAVAFLLTHSPRESLQQDAQLLDRLLATLMLAVSGTSGSRPKWWVGGGGDWVTPLQELFWWAASPADGAQRVQARLLRALYAAPAPALQLLTPPDPPAIRKLAVYLLTMLKQIHAEAETGPPAVELAITDWARGWAVGTQAGLPERLASDALAPEAASLLRADEQRWARAKAKARPAIAKVVFSKDGTASKVTETAMALTRGVVEAQNGERKAFMEHLRRAHTQHVAAALAWRRLVRDHTHEQAVWHDPRSYPSSWQLDATEGPGRVRVRLRRAHLNIHPRFLKPQYKYKTETTELASPLHSVVDGAWTLRGGLVARLQLNETVAYMARVTHVTVASETRGELLLSDRCIHFVPEDYEEESNKPRKFKPLTTEVETCAQSWALEAVVQVVTRRWCLQELAVELFLSSGHAQLLAFADQHERAAFLKALAACHLPCRIEPDTLTEAMNQWRNGNITNWEYLMRLNGLGGRSYNDLMQYPVLPFVIADYTSRILDLNNPASFRDLSKPMAVQNKNREQHYINNYNDLKAARVAGCSALSRAPHHYASLYSNSGGVLHYLVRLPPFTSLFLNYQDNNFDMPDRTFHSLATTWRLITNDSPTDVKELIPELFYLPELFQNNEGLNLGVRQCGAAIDDVELPPWAADARLFTLVHRQALEAAHVTETLPHWIDLVFGYKQTGQAALDAINVFPACTYYGFDPGALEYEVDRTAAETMVRTYGQAPRQLLRAPHPHAQPDLAAPHHARATASVWAGVEGARWGQYCGSPALAAPTVGARRTCAGAASLLALPLARSVAATTRTTALVPLHGETAASNNQNSGERSALALVTWGHSDNIVRLKRRRDARPDLLLHMPALDQITKVSSSCVTAGCPYPLFIGHVSGRVLAVRVRSGAGQRARTRQLHAHAHAVSDMFVCARAGLLVTASTDGKIVLWDLSQLSYIRTLPNRDMLSVTHVTISETLCDVASVHAPASAHTDVNAAVDNTENDADAYEKDPAYKYESLIRVHTCNAKFVGSVKVSERVTCVCYSNAPEGVSVNCVAAGLRTGAVRLYSSWDLRALRYIPPADTQAPLLSLTYSSDSSVLFGCYGEGAVVGWESAAPGRAASIRIHPAHSLF